MRYLTSLFIAINVATAFATDEPPPGPTAAEIRTLIDQLVSPNPMPITAKEDKRVAPDYRLPEGFDRKKQKPVYEARQKLKQLGPIAFPFLIERRNDTRYCITMSVGINGYCFNATVGNVCRDIVFDQLQSYGIWPITQGDPRGKPKRPGYPTAYLNSIEDATKWYEKNKAKTLYEMQLMVIDWVIGEESIRPDDFTDEERAEVKKIRSKLIKAGKPIDHGNYDGNDTEA